MSDLHSFEEALLIAPDVHNDLAIYFIAKNEIVSQGQNTGYGVRLVDLLFLGSSFRWPQCQWKGGETGFFLTGD
jgi:hypothetical protein